MSFSDSRQSQIEFDFKETAVACLLLACKITDCHQNIKQIIVSFDFVFKVISCDKLESQPVEYLQVIDPTSDTCNYLKSRTIQMEVEILHALGYEVQRLLATPHKFMLMFLKTLKADKELAESAFGYCNDAFLGSACLNYPPELLASACILLAYRSTGILMPRVAWWLLADYSWELVSEAAASVYQIYGLQVPSLREACYIVQAAGRKTDKAFSVSPMFGHTYYDADKEKRGLRDSNQPPALDLGRDTSEVDQRISKSRDTSSQRKDKKKKHKKKRERQSRSSSRRRSR